MIIEYNKRKYTWHNNTWTHNNLVVATDLAQKLTRYCLDNDLIKKEDKEK